MTSNSSSLITTKSVYKISPPINIGHAFTTEFTTTIPPAGNKLHKLCYKSSILPFTLNANLYDTKEHVDPRSIKT